MIVYLHGFDWTTYKEQVMPAFARWLTTKDESLVRAQFEQTRCATEEAYLPAPMQHLRSWLRAQAFVEKLPRGSQSRKEYELLCSPAQFTALSDGYLHRHMPKLYQNPDALRTVWGAIIETSCLPWRQAAIAHATSSEHLSLSEYSFGHPFPTSGYSFPAPGHPFPAPGHPQGVSLHEAEDSAAMQEELVGLLKTVGLTELAREVDELTFALERSGSERIEIAAGSMSAVDYAYKDEYPRAAREEEYRDAESVAVEDELDFSTQAGGVEIGSAANLLPLRGWLAGVSLRAMALFEYLACGRRVMPFGCIPGDPYNYSGYLTADEVQQLARCLVDLQPPVAAAVDEEQQRFQQQASSELDSSSEQGFRLPDEVLPLCAAELLQAICTAAAQQLGLICCAE